MIERTELLESAFDLIDEGIILLDRGSNVILCNAAAAALTGHCAAELLTLPCPADLYAVDEHHRKEAEAAAQARMDDPSNAAARFGHNIAGYAEPAKLAEEPSATATLPHPTLVNLRHRLGHAVPAMLRRIPLHDAQRNPIGAALLFHCVEARQALPHGDPAEGVAIERTQADMEDRLDAAYHQWHTHQTPLGLLWITVDQAAGLRKTHGRDAREAMLRIVEHTVQHGLNPGEVLGRWGKNEFLALSHERSPALLLAHAQRIAGLARTADFRWWGDRVSLTISVGAVHAAGADTLPILLDRAQHVMNASVFAGGNHVTASREHTCSQS